MFLGTGGFPVTAAESAAPFAIAHGLGSRPWHCTSQQPDAGLEGLLGHLSLAVALRPLSTAWE